MGCRSKTLYQVVEEIEPISIGIQVFVQKNVRSKCRAPHCKTNSKLILNIMTKICCKVTAIPKTVKSLVMGIFTRSNPQ